MAKTEWAAEVMVRLNEDDLIHLNAVARPGEARAHTFLRCMRNAILPSDVLLRYKLPEEHKNHRLFPNWSVNGPMTADQALWKGELLLRKGYLVETKQVEPGPPWNGEG